MSRTTLSRSLIAGVLTVALGGCAVAGHTSTRRGVSYVQGSSGQQIALHGHPQAVDPVAGATGSSGSAAASVGASPQQAEVTVGPPAKSLPTPLSNSQVLSELAASGISANPNRGTMTPNRLAIAPVDAPAPVQAVINAGNEIAHLPYIWGGGHMTFEDTGYDCSGSLSFVLAAAGLLKATETSGELMNYGDPGPGKWITIFANQGHTFAYIAGLRFDTVALAETGSRWSNRKADEPDLSTFAVRHPPGL
ncbi:MAG TPA: hypothetical protein VG405_08540 [Solirubrobacteraceae bacterium]|nr:hypothetical protein [Solirubrobacteraceae bacterium]